MAAGEGRPAGRRQRLLGKMGASACRDANDGGGGGKQGLLCRSEGEQHNTPGVFPLPDALLPPARVFAEQLKP